MLVELGLLVEQHYKAVGEVLDGATLVDVDWRNGVADWPLEDPPGVVMAGFDAGC